MKKVAKRVGKNKWRVFYELENYEWGIGCVALLVLAFLIKIVYGA